MAFINPIAQRRRMSMIQRPTISNRLSQNSSPRGQMLNDPNEPEIINRPPDVDRSSEYREELSKIRGNTPMSDQYRQMLGQAPTREEHQPGKLTRLAAVLGGASEGWRSGAGAGINTARGINENDYQRATDDYYEQLQGAHSGAELERRDVSDRIDDYDTSMNRRDSDLSRADVNFEGDRADSSRRFGDTTGRLQAETAATDVRQTGEYYTEQGRQGRERLGQGRERLGLERDRFDYEQQENKRQMIEESLDTLAEDPETGPPPGHYDTDDMQRARESAIETVAFSPEFRDYWNLDLETPIPRDDVPEEIYRDMMEAIHLHSSDYLERTYYGGY